MKTIKVLGLLFAFFISTTAFTNIENATNNPLEISVNPIDDCAKFLKDYEKFIDKYIVVLKKYKANPTDMPIMQDYTELASKAGKFSSKNPGNCSVDQTLKLAKIAEKLTKAMSKMY